MLVTGHTQQPSPERGGRRKRSYRLADECTTAECHKKSPRRRQNYRFSRSFSVTRDSIPETTTEKCETFILSGFSFFAIHPIDFPLRFSFILLVRPLSLSRRSPRTHKQHGTPHDGFFFLLRRFTIE